MRDPSDCQTTVQRAVAAFGTADCLVNSAIKMAPAPLADLALEDWRTVIDVGLTGTFLMTQAFGRWVIAHGAQRRGGQPLVHGGRPALRGGRRLLHREGRGAHADAITLRSSGRAREFASTRSRPDTSRRR